MGLRTGSITFGGLASGFPTNEIVDQVLELERRPIDILEGQKSSFEEKLAIFQDLNTKTRSFQEALRELDNLTNIFLTTSPSATEEFAKLTATSSDSTVATATADSKALPGKVLLQVTQLATSEREISQGYTNKTDTVGTGNFRITVGTTVTNLTITSSNNTLEGFISAINDSSADVRAFLLNDGSSSPYRIVIEGKSSGATQTLDLSTGTTLSGGTATPSFTETQSAASATLLLDPGANQIQVSSTTNTFSSVIEGLTIEAKKVSASTVTIDVSEDTDAMVSEISNLVSAFNDIVSVINEQAVVDPETNRGGPLIGDSTLNGLKRRLTSVLASQIGSGTIKSSAEIGIELTASGTVTLDETKLRSKLQSSFNDVKAFFAGSGGFADQLRIVADAFVDPVSGALVTRIDGTNRSISDLEKNIADAEDRLEDIESDLIRQFAQLERIISEIQTQGQFLSQFLLTLQRR
ncbi:MAG: flagellar filament capping protein FliD [Myxococcota bacterium]